MNQRLPVNGHRRRAGLMLLLALLACGCANRPTGYSDFDTATDFSQYRTFAWVSPSPLVVASASPINPALQGILMDEVKRHLTAQGYRYVARKADADMAIGFAVGGQGTLRTTTYPGQYRQDFIVGQVMRTEVRSQDSTEGGLAIDIFDQSSGHKKWMGWVLKELTMNDLTYLQPTVQELVKTILGHFPPGGRHAG